MKKSSASGLLSLALISGFSHAAQGPSSGIATEYIEASVRPQDDFFAYQNGKWLKSVEIPSDMPFLDTFVQRYLETVPQLRGILEKAAAGGEAQGADARRVGDLYASYMDEARLERLGMTPLKPELDRIAALKDKSDLPALLARMQINSVTVPFNFSIGLDSKDAIRYAVSVAQGGLGLPDADYYLKPDDKKLAGFKARYQAHIERVLRLAGIADAAASAHAIVGFETALAKVQWTPVELRDPVKGYNKVMLADLGKFAPGFDWNRWLDGTGIAGRTDYVIVRQPSYLKAVAKIAEATPLDTWKAYLSVHLIMAFSPYLSNDFAEANFDFFGRTLEGTDVRAQRWKRGVGVVESNQGEPLGKLYVAEYFPPQRKLRVQALVNNLLLAFRQSIDKLDWMSLATKKEAQTKLARMRQKIGYPDKWVDYSALVIKRDDLVGNVMRVNAFEAARSLNKLGKPVDRELWSDTPQTVNAFYSPTRNEIVFPAAILQPPFFDENADDAVNYGAIGTVIAHEISHGFDDEGAQYDGDGNLRDWWTAEDHTKFKARTDLLVKQYSVFEPLPGYHVNGELTLGENIADNSGLAIAVRAYHLSLKGKPAPVIDGFTGDQRLYLGFGQNWRQMARENFRINLLKTDPHAPGMARTNGTLPNQPGFYEAFGVKPGDRMYRAPQDRVSIW